MARGPFHLTICPGAWSAPAQWAPVQAALARYPAHLSGVSCADWPAQDASAGLQAHADAVQAAIPAQAEQVILLGHSFGAFPMLEAAARAGRSPEGNSTSGGDSRIKGLAFLDGFVPAAGQTVLDHSAGRSGQDRIREAASDGLVPPPDPAIWKLAPQQAKTLQPSLRQQPLLSFEQGLSPAAAKVLDQVRHKAFLNASSHQNSPFRQAFNALEGRKDWFALQIDGGHMLHVERPAAVAYWVAQFLSMAAGKGF